MRGPVQISWEEVVRRLIADPGAAVLVRDCYFDPPLEAAAARYHASVEWASVRQVVGKGPGMALDVGAGNGIVSYALTRDGWTVTALEPDPSELVGAGAVRALANHVGGDIHVVVAFGEKVALPANHFDLIVLRQVLHHARDLNSLCCEMARLLKPGGILFSFRDHVADNEMQKAEFLQEHPLHRLYGGENAFSEVQYRQAFIGAGLTVERCWGHFGAPFNFSPLSREDVVRGAARKVLPGPLAAVAAAVLGNRRIYPLMAAILSKFYRRPGRHIAFLARKPR